MRSVRYRVLREVKGKQGRSVVWVNGRVFKG